MIVQTAGKWKLLLFLACFLNFPAISFAQTEDVMHQQAFTHFEKGIYSIITASIEPLGKHEQQVDEESLYQLVLAHKDELAKANRALQKIKVPLSLPGQIKTSLEKVKTELAVGFLALEESMDALAQYIANRNPALFEVHTSKREKGFAYIDGGLTSLATVRIRLFRSEHPHPNGWQVRKTHFYELEKAVLESQDEKLPICKQKRQ